MTTTALFPSPVRAAAVLSDCGRYRYALTRTWDDRRPVIAWVMLNPSTADATVDDNTIRRVIRFARAWGAGGVSVVNLFAFRATKPAELYRQADSIGPMNDATIVAATEGRRAIVAWGRHGKYRERDRTVLALLKGRSVEALHVNADGTPKHPLYCAGSCVPRPYELAEVK